MKIKKLTAKNFRLFTDLEINFPDENFICLIGNNGSGKSAVLDAVNMLMSTAIIHGIYWGHNNDDFRTNFGKKWQNENDIHYLENSYKLKLTFNFFEKENYAVANLELNKFIDFKSNIRSFINIAEDTVPICLYFDVKRLETSNKDNPKNYFNNPILNSYNHLVNLNKINSNISTYQFEDWYTSFILSEFIKKGKNRNLKFELPDLIPIRSAIDKFFELLHSENYKTLSVITEEPKNLVSGDKLKSLVTLIKETNSEEDHELKLSQLSSGEKMVTFMVAEIARKLTIANENKAEALNGKGVVLIDELDLHLHPNWQRNIVGALKATFPNVQFITTTHSPQVLSSLKASEIIEIDGDKVYSPSVNPYGRSSDNILSNVMNDGARAKKVDELINSVFINFAEDKNETAIQQIEELKKLVANDDPIFGRFESIIKRKEILNS